MLGTAKALATSPIFSAVVTGVAMFAYAMPTATCSVLALLFSSLFLQLDLHVKLLELVEPRVRWRCTSREALRRGLIGLTIDDVPLLKAPSHLEEILDVLKEHQSRATLMVMSGFTTADEATRSRGEALLARAVAEGHELGNHHMYDEPAFALPAGEMETKFIHCHELLKRLQPRAGPRWHRPASGVWTSQMLALQEAAGYEAAVMANLFPHDTAAGLTWLHRWLLTARARPGAVALVHDRPYTPETLRVALPRIRVKGLHCVTLSELFDA